MKLKEVEISLKKGTGSSKIEINISSFVDEYTSLESIMKSIKIIIKELGD